MTAIAALLSAGNFTLCSPQFRLSTFVEPWIGNHRSVWKGCKVFDTNIYAYCICVGWKGHRLILESECAEPSRNRTLDRAGLDNSTFWQFSTKTDFDIANLTEL